MNMERCKAPDPRPSTPNPFAQLEAMMDGGYSVHMRRNGEGGRIAMHASHPHKPFRTVFGDTIAATIDALARKVGSGG